MAETSIAQPLSVPINKRRLPKSRNGCQTCKIRKLKCDETKPSCNNCVKRGNACPGYLRALKWSTKHELSKDSIESSFQLDIQAINAPPNPATQEPSRHSSSSPSRRKSSTDQSLPRPLTGHDVGLPRRQPKRRKLSVEVSPCDREAISVEQDADIIHTNTVSGNSLRDLPQQNRSLSSGQSGDKPRTFLQDAAEMFFKESQQRLGSRTSLHESSPLHGHFQPPYFCSRPISASVIELDSTGAETEEGIVELPRLSASISPSDSKSLLRSFYRLPQTSPTTALLDTGTYLIQHYFSSVCTIFSSFDSKLNPFRMTVSRLWGDSASIYFAIQSMAAAHLANEYPRMAAVGVEMQKRANESLQNELQLTVTGRAKPERALLTLLLLGLSACWHRADDLGMNYLRTARGLMTNKLLQDKPAENREVQRQDQFFEEALVYWEMMMGFVAPNGDKPAPGDRRRRETSLMVPVEPRRADSKILPHPWTGVAPQAQILLAEVGRLVREERLDVETDNLEASLLATERRFELAQTLEEELLAIEPPDPESLVDVGDERTSKRDFLIIAEATRCAAVLDLYRIFPELLRRRLGVREKFTAPQTPLEPLDDDIIPALMTEDAAFSMFFNTPAFATPTCLQSPALLDLDMVEAAVALGAADTMLEPSVANSTITASPASGSKAQASSEVAFINSLATHVCSLIESVPAQSGTRFLQLMLLVMAASELRFAAGGPDPQTYPNLDFFDPGSDDVKVVHARRFTEARLMEHAKRLPDKPVRRMLETVREVWRRADGEDSGTEMGIGGGAKGVFWLDVMVEKGWETVMG